MVSGTEFEAAVNPTVCGTGLAEAAATWMPQYFARAKSSGNDSRLMAVGVDWTSPVAIWSVTESATRS